MCAHCRMAISQKQFAAEILLRDESVAKFDDIGCMLSYLKESEHNENAAAIFAVDYETKQWVDVHNASFLKTQKVQTPMGGGILAFAEPARAESASRQFQGSIHRFAELPSP